MKLGVLIGSGHRIGLLVLPFLAVGLGANILRPAWFRVGGPPAPLAALAWAVLAAGVAVWAWSAYLVATRVPRGELITGGPFAAVKHPLYTGVALLVLPWAGFLCDSWLGVAIGGLFYLGRWLYASREEQALAARFGEAWQAYARSVWLPWL